MVMGQHGADSAISTPTQPYSIQITMSRERASAAELQTTNYSDNPIWHFSSSDRSAPAENSPQLVQSLAVLDSVKTENSIK
ncbi:hypothetical protein N7539_009184 [Penicillium diatomitis]|uniref:Uncharacterized protein n=1 Tax=Penicillium diatomitis TaxID=2819901 RepID=A0A9X0BJG4_9EURO|nr:uncharacterized protein N7539_009184 [Penicillium diatomitis]KAJ5469566.1 hypothetical protein N7539_009184 [Penicillium diatomitis]